MVDLSDLWKPPQVAYRMKLIIKNFNLDTTLNSGQFFRFEKNGDWYCCQEEHHVFKIRQMKNTLEFYGVSQKYIFYLFGLNDDYNSILLDLEKDITLNEAIGQYKGLRLMNRDPWETIISFLCSIMSNIPKIKGNMHLLARNFGQRLKFENKIYFSFPKPGQLNSMPKIIKSRVGFRAKYLYSINKKIYQKNLTELKKASFNDARNYLQQFPGIGPKVADCICLFSLNKKEAFPSDVWIERVMKQKYNIDPKHIQAFAKDRWGPNAGYAQQFLFHETRHKRSVSA